MAKGAAAVVSSSPYPGQAAQRELAAGPFPKERSHPAALPKERYALSPWRALCHVTRRQLLLVGRDKMVLQGRIMQVSACVCEGRGLGNVRSGAGGWGVGAIGSIGGQRQWGLTIQAN